MPQFYDESQITRAEQRMGISRKRNSISAVRAFAPVNLIRRIQFWTQPYPVGIADVPRSAMVDLDEARLVMDQANRRYSKGRLGYRCRTTGHYKADGRLLLAAISGSEDGERWLMMEDRSGTTLPLCVRFIRHILDGLGQGMPGNRRCIVMDNLNVHKHPVVLQMITQAGHMHNFRAPYWPKDGAIEYFFNTVEVGLKSTMFEVDNVTDMEEKILNIVAQHPHFIAYFENCGYR